jgi:hypothetical protein
MDLNTLDQKGENFILFSKEKLDIHKSAKKSSRRRIRILESDHYCLGVVTNSNA